MEISHGEDKDGGPLKSIQLIFGCHSHQPVGNFDFVFQLAYDQAYLPFLEVLERYPAVRVTHHFTGPLFDWFEANRPEFLERLGALADSGRVEIMGGGYYEPLLCAVPERDSIAQIQRMNAFCERHFRKAPRGMWLAERVWEPHMPRILGSAGVEYTAVDDTHFLCAGLTADQLFGYYVTEDEGLAIKVFPILEKLRYLIPFHQVKETIAFLKDQATDDGLRCAVIHDDGEKFGLWPETHRSVYEEGWLEEFCKALTDNQDWLHCVTYSEYLAKTPALGRIYLPTASYQEMMAWALPTPMHRRFQRALKAAEADAAHGADLKAFLRGSFWRSFLAKYPEANNVQKRMLRVSARLNRLHRSKDPRVKEAERLLHQGQCNCAYWHGVFGGLYLNHLRTAVYEKLVEADRILDDVTHKDDRWVSCETVDLDVDGNEEAVLENAHLSLFFSPTDGGTLFEWDYKDHPFNFGNTLTRREEVYHDLLRQGGVQVAESGKGDRSIHELARAKEAGLDSYLVYDPYRRVSLRDHFLHENVTPRELWAGTHQELGDFATGVYTVEARRNHVVMAREGTVWLGDVYPVSLRKTVILAPRASSFEIRYDIRQRGEWPLRVVFGVEFAVNLLSGASFDRYYRSDDRDLHYARLGEMGREEDLAHLALRDDWQRLECGFRFDAPARIYRFGIETVSQSENGQERVYQASVVIPCWVMTLPPGQAVARTIVAEAVRT
jgi:alpha-amylase